MSAAVRLVQVHHDLCERHTFVKHKNNNDYRLSANSNSSHNNILNFELRQQLGKTTEESGYLPSWVKIFKIDLQICLQRFLIISKLLGRQ